MKTYLTYGFGMSMATLLLALILFFLGYHSEVEKVGAAQTIATVGGLVIGIVGVVLGTRARRAEIPASEPFGYGRALGAGVMIGLFSAIFGIVANRVYMAMIKEANACIDEGIATREQVDALMVDCFRWPVGPFGMVQGASSGWGQ